MKMGGKLIIFIVFVAVLKSSFAQYSPTACVKQTGLELDLGVINHGREVSIKGLRATIRRLFSLMEYEATQHTFGNHTEAERAFRIANAKRQADTAIMDGIPPTLDAIKVVHPAASTDPINAYQLLTRFNAIVVSGINLINLDCYEDAKSQLEVVDTQLMGIANILSDTVLGAIIGNTTFPDKIVPLIECTKEQVHSDITASFKNFVYGLEKLVSQSFTGNKETLDECLKQIRLHEQKAFIHIRGEVIGKFVLLENMYLSKYQEEAGILGGIFAFQAAAANIAAAESIDSNSEVCTGF